MLTGAHGAHGGEVADEVRRAGDQLDIPVGQTLKRQAAGAGGDQAMSQAANRRLLRLPEVKERVGLSRTAIYRLIAEGQFPRQDCIGPRTVAWCQEDLEAWIEQRIQAAMGEPAERR